MSTYEALVISDTESFSSLEAEWDALLKRSRCRSIFLTWPWLFTWWAVFNPGLRLNIVTIRDQGGELVGIGPFCICDSWGKYPLKVLGFLGASPISSEYLDVIVDPRQEAAVVAAIFDQILTSGASCDCLVMSDTLETSNVFGFFENLSSDKRFVLRKKISQICPYLELQTTHSAVLANFKSQLRSTIKRRTNKLNKMGARLKLVSDDEELEPYLNKLFELHQKCWNARGEPGNFADPRIRSFHSIVSRRMLSRDWLRLYVLEVDGDTIAALYAFQYENSVFYYQSGFDIDWTSKSPGTVLMWLCLCDAIDREVQEFDYLRGAEFYKSLWADKFRTTYSLTITLREKYLARACFFQADLLISAKSKIKKALRVVGLYSDNN